MRFAFRGIGSGLDCSKKGVGVDQILCVDSTSNKVRVTKPYMVLLV